MSLIQNIIRSDVRALSAYHVQDAAGFVKLDAMENPYTLPPELQRELGVRLSAAALNRYPVPTYTALKKNNLRKTWCACWLRCCAGKWIR